MLVSDFDYYLPPELIAQKPLADRAASRLLHVCGTRSQTDETLEDRNFKDFPELLRPNDLVVFNNTQVFPARLFGRRSGLRAQRLSRHNPASREFLHGRVEVLLTSQVRKEPNEWQCLVRPGRKIGVGEKLFFAPDGCDSADLEAEVISRAEFGERLIRFAPTDDFFAKLEKIGHVPLPPYISRPDASADWERYQTVYARTRGSVAAPTAGLHFTYEILNRIRDLGIETTEITLHVGLGTFQTVHAERVEDHQLHSEFYSISEDAAGRIDRARSQGRRIVAIGTTTVRTLEFAAQQNSGEIEPSSGEAKLFIYPGYKFQVVGALLTNFHLPKSTLLMLACAFGGNETMLRAYRHAVEQRYRFYSYGDCMFVE